MLMRICHFCGRLEDAMSLSVSGDVIRIVLSDNAESVEFRFRDGEWAADRNDPLEVEFIGASLVEGIPALRYYFGPATASDPNCTGNLDNSVAFALRTRTCTL